MKTKIVYVVVSDKESLYAEQAIVSAYSARVYNPDIQIEVVVDTNTADYINNSSQYFYAYFDKTIVIDIPTNYSEKQRSRYLKTNLRKYVVGDYLFIDTDTIICGSLEEIDKLQYEISAVREYNKISYFTTTDRWMNLLAEKACIVSELKGEPYFNSGVMYVKDTPSAHSFYECWHECWLKTKEKGVDTDQTALCWANKLEGHVINHMDNTWNCQIKTWGIKFLPEAKIIHYFWGLNESNYLFSHHSIFQTVRELKDIPPIVKDLIKTPKLQLITPKEYLILNNVNILKSHYRIFYSFIEWICKVYVYIRMNWVNKKIFKR